MFHRHDTQAFDTAHAPYGTGGAWYVSDDEYQEALRRGMYLRSRAFADAFSALGRGIAGLFKR